MKTIVKLFKVSAVIFMVFSVSTVLTSMMVIYFYWSQGTLTQNSLKDIRAILEGRDPTGFALSEEIEMGEEIKAASQEEINEERMLRVVGLHNQMIGPRDINAELVKISDEIDRKNENLIQREESFDKKIEEIAARNQSDQVQKTRDILSGLKPDLKKIEYLMKFETEDCVTLLNGMESQEISKILQAFADSGNEAQKRGQDILQQIYNGGELGNELKKFAKQPAQETQQR